MKSSRFLHPWDVTPQEAVEIQNSLKDLLQLKWEDTPIRRAGSFDL